MKNDRIYKGENFKVLKIEIQKGEFFPVHNSTEDVFIFINKGKCKFSFEQKESSTLSIGECLIIRANEHHRVDALEDSEISIVIQSDGKIAFA
ncbi:MAG: hypothetical protein M9887_09090 [Chitinophagales bacterium]|nr:hypothetical protein [Chitinophagales bacterium]